MTGYPPPPGTVAACVLAVALREAKAKVAECRAKHRPTRAALKRLQKVRTMALRYENGRVK